MVTKDESDEKEKPAWLQMIGYCYHCVPWLILGFVLMLAVKFIGKHMSPLF